MTVPWFFHIPVALITCMDKFKKPNIITIAWIGIVNTEPPMIGISIRPTSYSYTCIKKSKAFVVNIPSESMIKKVDLCGSVSGRKINKFKAMGFTPVFAQKVKAPMIEECAAHLECEVRKVIPLGSHDLFLGEVVAFHIKEWAKNYKGELDVTKIKPLVYCTVARQYSGLGPRLEYIGFMRHRFKSKAEVGSFTRFWKKILSKVKILKE